MSFHEVRFPASLSFGALGGPERRTQIVALSNGFEERATPWADSRRRYDAGLGLRSLDDLHALVAFFEARRGQLNGFRWKDWADFKSSRPSREVTGEDQELGRGDGVRRAFQLIRRYRSGAQVWVRTITKPVAGTVRVMLGQEPRVESIDWTVDLATGVVTFTDPPPLDVPVTAGFEFDVPVRFDTDRVQVSVASFQAGEMPSVPVIEVRT
jgi:uncharacterized protein (TIGR02217 family)